MAAQNVPFQHLRRDAKRFLASIRAGNTQALSRYGAVWPVSDPIGHATLMRVQHVIARERGHDQWDDLASSKVSNHPLAHLIRISADGALIDVGRRIDLGAAPITLVTGISGGGKTVTIGGLAIAASLAGRPIAIVHNIEESYVWAGKVLRSSQVPSASWSVHVYDQPGGYPDLIEHVHAKISNAIISVRQEAAAMKGVRGIVIIDEAWMLKGVDWDRVFTWSSGVDIVVIVQAESDLLDIGVLAHAQRRKWQMVSFCSHVRPEKYKEIVGFPATCDPSDCRVKMSAVMPCIEGQPATFGFADVIVANPLTQVTQKYRTVLAPLGVWVLSSEVSERLRLRAAIKAMPGDDPWSIVRHLASTPATVDP